MQITITKTTILLTIFFLLGLPVLSAAQSAGVFTLTADNLANGKTAELNEAGWKYQAGDDSAWANPNFDDAGWETLKNSAMTKDSLPQMGWNGSGWLRLRLNVAPALVNVPLNLEMTQLGASEIYLDGKLIKRYGSIGSTAATEEPYNPNAEPLSISFAGVGEHLLAVRYSNLTAADVNSGYGKWLLGTGTIQGGAGGIGFAAQIKNFDDTANQGWNLGFSFAYITVQATVFFSFFILHLLLFALYPRQRGNLYYSLYLIGVTLNQIFFSGIATYHFGTVGYYWFYLLVYFTFVSGWIPLLAFLYTDFERRIPHYIWVFPAVAALYLFQLALFHDTIAEWLYNVFILTLLIEMTRIMVRAIRNRMEDAWIVGIGVFLLDLALLREIVLSLKIYELSPNIYLLSDILGFYGLLLSITIYLARQFARTSTNLDAQLVKQVEHERDKAKFLIVEAENERRAKELEEARQLQLSMLPKKLPAIPNLEIAAYMKPATEVGGDYYDFHVSEDGTLTVAVGDATGHGLKAGTMVTAAKTLFNNLAHEPNIESIFKQSSAALKKLNLRGMFMAMTIVKIKEEQMTVSCAGMPSALIYRNSISRVEEVSIRAMPWGSPLAARFEQRELSLAVGDCIVLMSDGFPEMFNQAGEMLGFEKASEMLPQMAMNSPQEIINKLVKVGEQWANGRAADDDVTFVVLKVKTEDKGNF